MATNGPNLGLIEFETQGTVWVTSLKALLRGLDGVVMPGVKDKDLATPPGSPTNGDRYLVATSGTGDWSGHDGKIARYQASDGTGWEFFTPKEGWLVWVDDENLLYAYNGTAWVTLIAAMSLATTANLAAQAEAIRVPVGDETTTITTGAAKVTFRMPFAMTLTAVRAGLTTASSSGDVTVDINEAGTTLLSTKLTVDANEETSTTAAIAAVISDAALADDAEITLDIDAAGTGAAGLKVTLIGTRTP